MGNKVKLLHQNAHPHGYKIIYVAIFGVAGHTGMISTATGDEGVCKLNRHLLGPRELDTQSIALNETSCDRIERIHSRENLWTPTLIWKSRRI